MSIRKMEKLKVIVPGGYEEQVLLGLQNMGSVEMTAPDTFSLSEEEEKAFRRMNTGSTESLNALQNVRTALDGLKEYGKLKEGLFIRRKNIKEAEFRGKEIRDRAIETGDRIREALEQLSELRTDRAAIEAELALLDDWMDLDLDLGETETRTSRFYPLAFPISTRYEKVEEAARTSGACHLFPVSRDKQQLYIGMIVYKKDEEAVFDALRSFSFSVLSFPHPSGTPAKILSERKNDLLVNREKEAETIRMIQDMKGGKEALEVYFDCLTTDIDRGENRKKILTDDTVSYFEGWVPADQKEKVGSFLRSLNCAWETEEPKEEEYPDVPVSLRNNRITGALSMVTEMYSLPRYDHIDPNPLMAPFFILFYGIMMADMAYGLVLLAAGILVSKKYRPKGTMGNMFNLMIWCGLSTILFGALTGGFMGDFIPQLVLMTTGKTISLPAVISPLDDITAILIGSLCLGFVQIITGMVISVVLKLRKKQYLDALFNEFTWWTVFAGIGLYFFKGSLIVLLAGIALVVIGPLVTGKGFGKITGIFSSVYSNVTGYFGDILSYSRLMALMLSGSVIAQVFNTLGALFGNVVLFVVISLVGNLFNMALNVLGCYVHDLRLQCLEFFNKFYEDGGKPFVPLENRTKYVDIQ